MGFPRKNPNGGVEFILNFFEKVPGNFRFVTLPLEKQSSPLKILQNCVTLFGNSKGKNQDQWKFPMTFSWLLQEILHLFYWTPGIFTYYFFNTPGNSMSSTPCICLDFFWNSSMSLKSYYLPSFLKPGYSKNITKDKMVWYILSFHSQNFHQSSSKAKTG